MGQIKTIKIVTPRKLIKQFEGGDFNSNIVFTMGYRLKTSVGKSRHVTFVFKQVIKTKLILTAALNASSI